MARGFKLWTLFTKMRRNPFATFFIIYRHGFISSDSFFCTFSKSRNRNLSFVLKKVIAVIEINFKSAQMYGGSRIHVVKNPIDSSRAHTPLLKIKIKKFGWPKQSMRFSTPCLPIHEYRAIISIHEWINLFLHKSLEWFSLSFIWPYNWSIFSKHFVVYSDTALAWWSCWYLVRTRLDTNWDF